MRPRSQPRWIDWLLAGWMTLVGLLYFAQFAPYLSTVVRIVRRTSGL